MNKLKLDHIGLNAANKGEALVLAQTFCQLLGCCIDEKPASVYAGPVGAQKGIWALPRRIFREPLGNSRPEAFPLMKAQVNIPLKANFV